MKIIITFFIIFKGLLSLTHWIWNTSIFYFSQVFLVIHCINLHEIRNKNSYSYNKNGTFKKMDMQLLLIIKYSYQNSMQIAYNTTTWLAQLEEGQTNEWEVVGSNPSWTNTLFFK